MTLPFKFDEMCSSSRRGLLVGVLGITAFTLSLQGCVLAGIEPDEIDVADDTGEGGADAAGEAADDEGQVDTGTGDGDGGGDGDGDTGMGSADTTGDGDGDTGDSGETETAGDGDMPVPCAELAIGQLWEGDNEIEVFAGPSLITGECGAAGPESVYVFVAEATGDYEFSVVGLDGAITVADEVCTPMVDELGCVPAGDVLPLWLELGQVVHVIVDSNADPAMATVTIEFQGA